MNEPRTPKSKSSCGSIGCISAGLYPAIIALLIAKITSFASGIDWLIIPISILTYVIMVQAIHIHISFDKK